MKLRQSQQTLVTLANASEMVRNIATGVLGNEVSDTLNGTPINRNVIQALSQVQFQKAVSVYLKGA